MTAAAFASSSLDVSFRKLPTVLSPLLTHYCVSSFCIAVIPMPSPSTFPTRTCSRSAVPPFMCMISYLLSYIFPIPPSIPSSTRTSPPVFTPSAHGHHSTSVLLLIVDLYSVLYLFLQMRTSFVSCRSEISSTNDSLAVRVNSLSYPCPVRIYVLQQLEDPIMINLFTAITVVSKESRASTDYIFCWRCRLSVLLIAFHPVNSCCVAIGAESDKRSHHSTFPLATMLSRPGLQQASTLARANLQRQTSCLCAALRSFSRQETKAAYSTFTQREGSSS